MRIICYDSNNRVLRQLYQWDSNQFMIVEGVPTDPLPEFHFCNRLSSEALVVVPELVDGKLKVDIPNILLQQKEFIIAYLYTETSDDGHRTMHSINIPVTARAKPADYIFEENIEYHSYTLLSDEIEELRNRLDNLDLSGGGSEDDYEPISSTDIDRILNLI